MKGDLGQSNHELGGERAAVISGVNEQDLLDFMENVNHPDLSGHLSRHAGKNEARRPKQSAQRMESRRSGSSNTARCSGLDRRQDVTIVIGLPCSSFVEE